MLGGRKSANIRDSTDVLVPAPSDDGVVKIELWVDETKPPRGHAIRPAGRTPRRSSLPGGHADGDSVPFVGWLGLLRVLSDLFGRDDDLSEPFDRLDC